MPETSPPPYLSGPGGGPGGASPLPSPGGGAGPGSGGLTFDTAGGKRGPGDGGKRKGVIIGVVVIAALIVLLILVTRGGGDGGGGDAASAAAGFEAIVDDADFTDGVAQLRRCPIGDVEDLARAVAGRVDVDEDVLEGDDAATVNERPVDTLSCAIGVDADDVRGIYQLRFGASAVPRGDYEDYLTDDVFGDGADVEVEDPQNRAGGVVYPFCVEQADTEACGAAWVDEDDDLVVFVLLDGSSDVAEANAALDAVRADILRGLAGNADD